ncbi:class I SAM-dependent methyltransferase [Desulfatiferula olefinivorans]
MGHSFDYIEAVACEAWHNSRQNHLVKRRQGLLLYDLLDPLPGDAIVDIGCGTGEILSFLAGRSSHPLTGIDSSPYMLDFARQKLGHRVDLHRGFAEDLPFEDNTFDHALLINALEFVDDPNKAVAEAARVAKDRLFIGALNRYTVQGKIKGASAVLEKSLWDKAHFFSVWELKGIVHRALGDVPLSWRAVNLSAPAGEGLLHRIEQNTLIRKIPFGSYIGMVVSLVPTYRVRPLPLAVPKKNKTGLAGSPCASAEKKRIANHTRST